MKVTIAKALRWIKQLKGEIRKISERMETHVSWVEGKTPAYDFKTLAKEREEKVTALTSLKAAMHASNNTNKVKIEGVDVEITVQHAIFMLAERKAELNLYRELFLRNDSEERTRRVDGEAFEVVHVTIQHKSAMTEQERDKKVTEISKQIEHINDALEAHNHSTQIVVVK